jgi:membrane-associated phospholipid phosphatase
MARIYKDNRSGFYRFVTTDMMSRIVCGVFYFLMPTTNVRPEVVGTTFADNMLRFLYSIDQPANLFPSIHCLVSWMCYIGIRGNQKVPAWYRAFSCVFALLVVVSTQTTKQHYIADAVAGILLAEILFALNKRISAYRYVQTFFEKINAKLGLTNKENIIE